MTVRTLKDCRLVIVIFLSSCGKKGGGREGLREGGYFALAGRGHPLLVDSSSHMAAAAAGSQDSFAQAWRNRKGLLADSRAQNLSPCCSLFPLPLSRLPHK